MSATCPHCGKPVPPSAPGGICPECLLKAGIASQTGPGQSGPHGTRKDPTPVPTPEEIAPLFPQLEILECLGRGGMGAVYRARQPRLDRFVALKILSPERKDEPRFAERFTREARALARLNHPNIITVYDFGQTSGLYYLLMEFVDGVNLRQIEQKQRLAPREALRIIPEICQALQFAHDQGIVHRDIKPENILVDKRGRVKIADFGIAKILDPKEERSNLTAEQQVIGTPHYMAPEQVEHPLQVDHRADIFSLGVVFYEMLTGELPLGKFAPPSNKVHVDVRLDEVVLRALEKEPERRYQQASALRTEVETIASDDRPGSGAARRVAQGLDYRSRTMLFGLPLVHVASGIDPATGKLRVARGIIAIGNVAKGVVAIGGTAIGGFAFGGFALGGFAFGGFAAGLISLGGFALALILAVGGFAAAVVALGGAALGWYSYGGEALGLHAYGHDPAADRFFDPWAQTFLTHMAVGNIILVAALLLVSVGLPVWLARRQRAGINPVDAFPKQPGARIQSAFLALLALVAVVVVCYVWLGRAGGRTNGFVIGQTWFPYGDSIEITSVKRTPERLAVAGRYHLVSHPAAELALYITSTNLSVAEDSQQRLRITQGQGSFELTDSRVVPGLPHVSMYAGGRPFAALYFGNEEEARQERAATWIAKTNPDAGDSEALAREGWQLWRTGELDKAGAKFQQAAALEPTNADAWNGLGWAAFNSGKSPEAEKAFQRAVSINPDLPGALNGLGQAYLSQKEYDRAETYLLMAAPRAPAAWYGLARLYLLEAKFDQAEKWAQDIVDSGQADGVARKMLEAAKAKHLSEGLRFAIQPPPGPESGH